MAFDRDSNPQHGAASSVSNSQPEISRHDLTQKSADGHPEALTRIKTSQSAVIRQRSSGERSCELSWFAAAYSLTVGTFILVCG
ncbi:hypothetical protein BBP40_006955 [Aspergillus hancockii]|nr:hypothetical protein BBP40_006955 [Aspergillus hancockii]